jgi:hypothetical protein
MNKPKQYDHKLPKHYSEVPYEELRAIRDLCREVLRNSGAYMSGHKLAEAVLRLMGEQA